MKKARILLVLLFLTVFSTHCYAEPQNEAASQAEISMELKSVFKYIAAELKAGRDVKIRSFGTFYAQERQARQGRNPKTGERISIPAKRYPRFRSSDVLKRSLNAL